MSIIDLYIDLRHTYRRLTYHLEAGTYRSIYWSRHRSILIYCRLRRLKLSRSACANMNMRLKEQGTCRHTTPAHYRLACTMRTKNAQPQRTNLPLHNLTGCANNTF